MPSSFASIFCISRICSSVAAMILSIGFFCRLHGLFAARRFADSDGSCNCFRVINGMPQHKRSCSRGLHTQHLRQARGLDFIILFEPRPIGCDIARITYRQTQPIRRGFEHITNFKRRCLLSLNAIGIDRIHQSDGMLVRDLHNHRQAHHRMNRRSE